MRSRFSPLPNTTEHSDVQASGPKRKRWGLKVLHLLGHLVFWPLVSLAIIGVSLYLPPIQNILRKQAVDALTEKTGAEVRVERIALRFPIGLTIKGLFVADQGGDTLLHAGALKARIGLTALLNARIVLSGVVLEDVTVNVTQATDSSFNFDHIVQAFASTDTVSSSSNTSSAWDFTIEDISLQAIALHMDLRPSELTMDVALGSLEVDLDAFDATLGRYHIDELLLRDTRVDLRVNSGPASPDSYPALRNPLAGFDIRFNELDLESIAFHMKTPNTGDSLWLNVGSFEVDANEMDLSVQRIALSSVDLKDLNFGMLIGSDTTKQIPKENPVLADDGFRYFIRDWSITVDDLEMERSAFAMHRGSILTGTSAFDPKHLQLRNLLLNTQDVAVNNDRIALLLQELKGTGGPHDTPFHAQLGLEATPKRIEVAGGELTVAGTTVAVKALVRPSGLAQLMNEFEEVPIQLNVAAQLDAERLEQLLAAFEQQLPAGVSVRENLDARIQLAGTMDRIDTLVVAIDGDRGSVLHAKGSGSGFNDRSRTEGIVVVERLTLGPMLNNIMNATAPPGTLLPKRLSMNAEVRMTPGSLSSTVDLSSDLGNVQGTVHAAEWVNNVPNAFRIDLVLDRIDAPRLLGDTAWSTIDLHVKGRGTSMNTMGRAASLEIEPKRLVYRGMDLSTMRISADVAQDSVNLILTSDTKPVDLDIAVHGVWPIGKDSLVAEVSMDIRKLELASLGIVPHRIDLDGTIRGTIAMDTAGFGRINLNADGSRISNERKNFVFERFGATAVLNRDSTALDLDSDAITLRYHTNAAADSILPQTRAKVRSIFNDDKTYTARTGTFVDLEVTLPRPEFLTGLLIPSLQYIELERLIGRYNSDEDIITLDLSVPAMQYDSIRVNGLRCELNVQGTDLNGSLTIARVERDQLYVEGLSVEATTAGGVLITTLRVQPEEQEIQYRIGTELRTLEDIRSLHIQEDLILNGERWSAHPDNLLRFTRPLQAENMVLSAGKERVAFITGTTSTKVEFSDLELGTFSRMISTEDSTEFANGILTGEVILPDPETGKPTTGTVQLRDLSIRGVGIGTLDLEGTRTNSGPLQLQARLEHPQNKLDAWAEIRRSDITDIKAKVDLQFNDLSFLQPFLADLLYELKGGLQGDIAYEQRGDNVDLEGEINFQNTTVGTILTGATYTMPNERLTLDRNGVHFRSVQLVDSLGNRFLVEGDVRTDELLDPKLDLEVRTERFRLISSTIEQNPVFYGDLLTSMDLRIEGPVRRPTVSGDIGILEGTSFSVVLPGSQVELIGSEGIVVFTDDLDRDDTLTTGSNSRALRDSLQARLPGVVLDLRLKVDPAAKFAAVLDPTTGDQATFSGEGDLVFRYDPSGEMYLSGPFTVSEGGYTLEFYGLVKKRFDLIKGSSIRWSGDIMEAEMDVRALYISNSAPYPLVAGPSIGITDAERNRLQQPIPFKVIISVNGSIDDPSVDLGLDLEKDLRNSFPQVSDRLDQLQQPGSVEQRNRQVFGLLVLNSFIEDEANGGAPSNSIATSAARNSVNGLLTEQMNKLTGNVVKGVDISLGVNTYDQTSGAQTYQRTSLDYKVSKRILNDRLSFEVDGSVGVDEGRNVVSNVSNNRTAQYAILYDLTEDGRFRIRGFQENAFDLFDGEIRNSGVAIMFTKEFEENSRAREQARKDQRQRLEDLRKERGVLKEEED